MDVDRAGEAAFPRYWGAKAIFLRNIQINHLYVQQTIDLIKKMFSRSDFCIESENVR